MRSISERVRCWTLLLLGMAAGLAVAEEPFSPVTVRLVTDAKAVVPGGEFTVAIHQKLMPGYHTYWRNAGTLGLPTSVEWELPEGFKAGDLIWPTPVVTRMAAYRVWGYEGEVVLLTTMTAPASLREGEVITVKGEVRWMACGGRCYPSGKTLALTLPVGGGAGPVLEWKEAFDRVRGQQPRVDERWNVSVLAEGDEGRLRLRLEADGAGTGHDPGRVQFFGYDRVVSSDKPQGQERTPRGVDLLLWPEEFSGIRTNRLCGMLVAENGWGGGGEAWSMSIDAVIEGR